MRGTSTYQQNVEQQGRFETIILRPGSKLLFDTDDEGSSEVLVAYFRSIMIAAAFYDPHPEDLDHTIGISHFRKNIYTKNQGTSDRN